MDFWGDYRKSVTVVRGLGLDAVALALHAKQLKAACGSGGHGERRLH
jgi:translation initiation factor 1 (eIF-1/SUI1)